MSLVTAALACAGCSEPGPAGDSSMRSVVLETVGCEFASGRTGSGFLYEGDIVVTAAHLVARASQISIEGVDVSVADAELVAIDLTRDLAALRLPGATFSLVESGLASTGDTGLIVGGARSGTVPYEVRRVVELTIEEVLGTERHSRSGYELAVASGDGDSGAGAYDNEGRLIGMVFASGPDEDTTWVTAASEIASFVASLPEYASFQACP